MRLAEYSYCFIANEQLLTPTKAATTTMTTTVTMTAKPQKKNKTICSTIVICLQSGHYTIMCRAKVHIGFTCFAWTCVCLLIYFWYKFWTRCSRLLFLFFKLLRFAIVYVVGFFFLFVFSLCLLFIIKFLIKWTNNYTLYDYASSFAGLVFFFCGGWRFERDFFLLSRLMGTGSVYVIHADVVVRVFILQDIVVNVWMSS